MHLTREIQNTEDGSATLFIPQLNEHYHSIHGAIQESQFIFIDNGLVHINQTKIKIFEVGFGTGLNALLTFDYSQKHNLNIDYTSIEKYPLTPNEYQALNYPQHLPHLKQVYTEMHIAPWGITNNISDYFRLTKLKGDLTTTNIGSQYDLVYQDAFSPDKQPKLWCIDTFNKLFSAMNKQSVLVTYSAKGEVRRNMQAVGFNVERLPGPPGKREMLRATKI